MRTLEFDLSRLVAAHGYIERGWIQRTYGINNRVCMLGAIALACDTALETRSKRGRRLLRLVNRELPKQFRLFPLHRRVRVALFNDHHRRTKRDVLAVFERAIARQLARAEEPNPLKRLLRRIKPWAKLLGPRPYRQEIGRAAHCATTHGVTGKQRVDQRGVDRVDPHAGRVEPKQLTVVDF